MVQSFEDKTQFVKFSACHTSGPGLSVYCKAAKGDNPNVSSLLNGASVTLLLFAVLLLLFLLILPIQISAPMISFIAKIWLYFNVYFKL